MAEELIDASLDDIKVFLEEADEVLQLLDSSILKLEQQGDDLETIQEIFRAAHTLKGSSATLGHKKMAELTHHIENVFDMLRNGEISVTTGLIDILLTSLDTLRSFKEDIAKGTQSTNDCSALIAALSSVSSTNAGGQAAASDEGIDDRAPQPGNESKPSMDDELRDSINSEEVKGNKILQVKFKFVDDCAMPAVRAFQIYEEINHIGKILKSTPSEEDIAEGSCGMEGDAIFSSQESEFQLLSMLNSIPDIANVKINPFSLDVSDEAYKEEQEEIAGEEKPTVEDGKIAAEETASKQAPKQSRTVRVDVERLDKLMNLVGELVISRTQLAQIGEFLLMNDDVNEARKVLGEASTHIGKITNELQDEIVKARMLPIERVFNKFPRMVRDLARRCDKGINFIVTGKETELDRSVIEEIGDPLIHILRNAIDHGIESPEERETAGKPLEAMVKLSARHQEGQIIIEVEDDGRGIDCQRLKEKAIESGVISQEQASRLTEHEAVQLIFESGISTAKEVTQLSGRGVGMDIVKSNIEKINGTIEVFTELGKGSRFTIKLPLTLAIVQALLVSVSNHILAIPLGLIVETVQLSKGNIKNINKRETIILRESVLPLLRLADVFLYEKNGDDKAFIVVVSFGGNKVGLIVDRLVGEREIVVKTLGGYISSAKGISGATILGDGRVALIVDVPCLVEMIIREQRLRSKEQAS